MSVTTRNELLNKPLDPDLLAAPFQVQTNWRVITGAPSCGKTTLIEQLSSMGYQTIAETGRVYIEGELAKGRTLEEIFICKADELGMKELQLKTEHGLRPNDHLFLDRALPDCLAFYRLTAMDPNEFLVECFHHRYASVFILDRLPLHMDSVRLEDDPMADYLDHWHTYDYEALGYDVIRVPVLSPQERLSFILETLIECDLV